MSRLTTNKAEAIYGKMDRCRRTTTNVKNDLRAMWPLAKGGDRQAIEDLLDAIVKAEFANEQATTSAEGVMHRMSRIADARRTKVVE